MCILDSDVGDYWMKLLDGLLLRVLLLRYCVDGLLLRVITGIVITLHSVIHITL